MLRSLSLIVLLGVALQGVSAATGRVTGTVHLDPAPPIRASVHYRARTQAPILEPEPPRAIAYLLQPEGNYPAPGQVDEVTISQQGYQFRPAIVAVRTDTRVAFPNGDPEFHSVFSYSGAKRFDLGRFRSDEDSPVVHFDQPGLVKIYCEIHKHMRGMLLVLDTPWFAASDASGRFSIDGVPPGRYRLRVFLPSERTLERTVSVAAGETTRVAFGGEP
jgi:plastocyanin